MRVPFLVTGAALLFSLQVQAGPWVVNQAGSIFVMISGIFNKVSGEATPKAIAARGDEVWALSTKTAEGGFALMRWTPSGFTNVEGRGGVRLAVGPKGFPWFICDDGSIYEETSAGPIPHPGWASDLACSGRDGVIYVVGRNVTSGGHGIYRWQDGNWTGITGGARRLAVAPDGTLYASNDQGFLSSYDGKAWNGVPNPTDPGHSVSIRGHTVHGVGAHSIPVEELAVGTDGDLWAIGADNWVYHNPTPHKHTWQKVEGIGTVIAAQ